MRHSRKIERWLSVSVLQNASVSSAVSTSESMRCRVSSSHAALVHKATESGIDYLAHKKEKWYRWEEFANSILEL